MHLANAKSDILAVPISPENRQPSTVLRGLPLLSIERYLLLM
jgi:hypothetical protein